MLPGIPAEPLARSVVLELLLRADSDGRVSYAPRELAKSSGVEGRTCRYILHRLHREGLITELHPPQSRHAVGTIIIASQPAPQIPVVSPELRDPTPEEDKWGDIEGYWMLKWGIEAQDEADREYPAEFFEYLIEQRGLDAIHEQCSAIYHRGSCLDFPKAYLLKVCLDGDQDTTPPNHLGEALRAKRERIGAAP